MTKNWKPWCNDCHWWDDPHPENGACHDGWCNQHHKMTLLNHYCPYFQRPTFMDRIRKSRVTE